MKKNEIINECAKFLEDHFNIDLDSFYSIRLSDTFDCQGKFNHSISYTLIHQDIPINIDSNGYLNAKICYTLADQSEITIRIILT